MRCRTAPRFGWLAALIVPFLAACGSGGFAPPQPGARALFDALHGHPASAKIRHVIIIVQENRSLNNLFYGFPGADTTKYGYNSKNEKVELQPVGLDTGWDLDHSSYSFYAGLQRNRELSRHGLSDERLRQRSVLLRELR